MVLALGFTACDDNSDLGVMQTNPQEAIMSAGGVTVDYAGDLKGSALDLNQFAADGMIKVLDLTEAKDLPADAAVTFEMQIAATEDYSDAATLPMSLVDNTWCVNAEDWDSWFRSTLGRSPKAKTNYVRFAAYVASEGQVSRVGGPNTWFAAKQLSVTPVPMDFIIEEEYYLIGTGNDWQLDTTMPFKHSNADVYDDPTFSCVVEISEDAAAADGWWWKIAPKSAIESQTWDTVIGVEVNGDESTTGLLVDKDPQAGKMVTAGTYIMTINMEDMTYAFEPVSYLWTPGNSNGWNHADSQLLTFDADRGVYTGYAHLNGGFKFTDAANWDGTNYGNGGDGVLDPDGGAGNLEAPVDGLYYCEVDLTSKTYSITLMQTWGLIGGFNSWGASVAMTPSADFLTWTGTIDLAAGDEFKFRANDGWDFNLGGQLNNLVGGGDNLKADEAGKYEITLSFANLPYTATMTKK